MIHSYVFNRPSDFYWVPFLKNGRHWVRKEVDFSGYLHCSKFQFAVKRFGSQFYNLDSKLPEPTLIANFTQFANERLAQNDQLILVCLPSDRENLIRTDE